MGDTDGDVGCSMVLNLAVAQHRERFTVFVFHVGEGSPGYRFSSDVVIGVDDQVAEAVGECQLVRGAFHGCSQNVDGLDWCVIIIGFESVEAEAQELLADVEAERGVLVGTWARGVLC